MNEDKIIVIDDNGQEIEMDVLFTFDSEDTNKQYVLYFDQNNEDGEVFASAYTQEGELIPIDDEKEWEMINEVFETFMSAEETEHNHDHDHDHHHHDHDHDHHHHDQDHDHDHEHH